MSVVRRYNSLIFVAVTAIVLSTLACVVQVATPEVLTTPFTTVSPVPSPSTTPVTTLTTVWTAKVKLPTVNLRAEPSGKVIGSLTVGTTVEVAECVGNWCRIKKPAGWVWRGCLTDNPEKKGCVAK